MRGWVAAISDRGHNFFLGFPEVGFHDLVCVSRIIRFICGHNSIWRKLEET